MGVLFPIYGKKVPNHQAAVFLENSPLHQSWKTKSLDLQTFFVWESNDFFVDLKIPFSFYTVYQAWIFDLSTRPNAGSIKPKYFHPSCHNAFLSHIPEPNWAGAGQRRIWRTWVIECLENIWDQLLKPMHSKRHSKTTFLTQHKTNFREQPTGMMVPTIWLWRKWVTLDPLDPKKSTHCSDHWVNVPKKTQNWGHERPKFELQLII